MKKGLIYLVPIMSIFVLSVIIATYFMENIFNLIELARINLQTILPNSDYKILFYFSAVGIISIRRNRRGNKSNSY